VSAEDRLAATLEVVAEWSDSIKFVIAYSPNSHQQAYAKAQSVYAFMFASEYNASGRLAAAFAAAEDAYISALCSHFNTSTNLDEAIAARYAAARKPAP